MNTTIPNWTYLPELAALKEEILPALERVLQSGKLILGNELKRLEKDFASYCGSKFGIGVNSGTDALFLALKASGIKEGDEVLTVPNTAIPTISAIRAAGAKPRFVDIHPEFYTMDVSQLNAAVGQKTKAIIPVHLYGQSVDMDPLLHLATEKNWVVIEDCAQSHGTKYRGKMTGSLGNIGAFSFYPTKILGAYGDAGMCVTRDASLEKSLRSLRMYGMRGEYYSHTDGYNSRLDEIQAAILNIKLKYLEQAIAHRQKIAAFYSAQLAPFLQIPKEAPYSTHSYYLYVVRHPKREAVMKSLAAEGVETRIHFPYPIHLMEAFSDLGYRKGDFPATEARANEIFSLPLYPYMGEEVVEKVTRIIRKTLG